MMRNDAEKFVELVQALIPDVDTRIDAPRDLTGHWFLDFYRDWRNVVVEWRPGRGFGVSLMLNHGCYGEGPDEILNDFDDALDRVVSFLVMEKR